MTTSKVELLPLPEDYDVFGANNENVQDYARANVAHHTAAKDVEIDALRSQLMDMTNVYCATVTERTDLEARVEQLMEALRETETKLGKGSWHLALPIIANALHPTAAQEKDMDKHLTTPPSAPVGDNGYESFARSLVAKYGFCNWQCEVTWAAAQAAIAQQPAAHPDDAAVDAFAGAMKEKLVAARAKGRGGWDGDEPGMQQRLSNMLRAHVEKGDPRDVANFAMFLHQRGEAILPAQQPAAVDGVMVRLAKSARELQRKNYGSGSGLHLDMIDWAREFDALADQPGGSDNGR